MSSHQDSPEHVLMTDTMFPRVQEASQGVAADEVVDDKGIPRRVRNRTYSCMLESRQQNEFCTHIVEVGDPWMLMTHSLA